MRQTLARGSKPPRVQRRKPSTCSTLRNWPGSGFRAPLTNISLAARRTKSRCGGIREAFDALAIRSRVLVDVERIDTSAELFGHRLEFPVLLAPTAFHRLAHPEGEVETARGAGAGKAIFVVSSLSTRRVEDISRAATQPWFFQLFDIGSRRREFLTELLGTLEANGCRGLVVTADAPVTGPRNRSERAHFSLPEDFETPYYPDRAVRKQVGGLPVSGSSTWADLAWLRSKTGLSKHQLNE